MQRAGRIVLVLAVGGALLVSTGAAASTARTDGRGAQHRVVFLTDTQGGCSTEFERLLCNGFVRAARRLGVTGRIVTLTAREDVRDALSLLARQDYDLVIAFGVAFPQAIADVAPRYPAQRFALLDRSKKETESLWGVKWPRNVQGVVFRTSEAAYLAGWLAGHMERARPGRDAAGVVAGLPIVSVDDFAIGFRAGARRSSPAIKVMTGYSKNFIDRSACRAIARRQIARGAGVLFNVAGVCGLGTLEAAKQAGVWGVGVDTDQAFLGRHILTSVTKDFEAAFERLLRQVKAGKFRTGGDTVLTLTDGAVGLGKISPRVPAMLRREVVRLERRIARGELRVPGAFRDPR